jgi:hypothetical protein
MLKLLNNIPFLNTIKLKLLGVLLSVIALFTFGFIKKKEGKQSLENDILKDQEKRKDRGREAGFKEKRAIEGLSDSDVLDRLRRRDGDWGSL